MSWNLELLWQAVERRDGAATGLLCRKSLQSIWDRQRMAGYHFDQYKQLIAERFPVGRTSIDEMRQLIRGGDDAWEAHEREFEASANVIACLQNLHCMADTLAQVIYLALMPVVPGLQALQDHRASIATVRAALSKSGAYPKVEDAIDRLCTHPDFVYLNDLVNHGKHRRIVGLEITIDGQSELAVPQLELGAFEHGTRSYPKREIEPFLNGEFVRQSHLLVEIGQAINDVVV
jgi:hypothetical protein